VKHRAWRLMRTLVWNILVSDSTEAKRKRC